MGNRAEEKAKKCARILQLLKAAQGDGMRRRILSERSRMGEKNTQKELKRLIEAGKVVSRRPGPVYYLACYAPSTQ